VWDTDALLRLVEASQRSALAVIDGRVVGFIRAITDGISNGYLSMVVVDEACRRTGIGRALVEHVVDGDDHVTWVLRAGRAGATEFFTKLGFAVSREAMQRTRRN